MYVFTVVINRYHFAILFAIVNLMTPLGTIGVTLLVWLKCIDVVVVIFQIELEKVTLVCL